MLGQFVSAAAGVGVRRLRERMRTLAAGLLAIGLLAGAFVFCLLALYLWLSAGPLEPWQAALAIAGLLAAGSAVILLAIRLAARRRPSPGEELAALSKAMADSTPERTEPNKVQVPLLVAAAVAGLVIGRRL